MWHTANCFRFARVWWDDCNANGIQFILELPSNEHIHNVQRNNLRILILVRFCVKISSMVKRHICGLPGFFSAMKCAEKTNEMRQNDGNILQMMYVHLLKSCGCILQRDNGIGCIIRRLCFVSIHILRSNQTVFDRKCGKCERIHFNNAYLQIDVSNAGVMHGKRQTIRMRMKKAEENWQRDSKRKQSNSRMCSSNPNAVFSGKPLRMQTIWKWNMSI